MNIFS